MNYEAEVLNPIYKELNKQEKQDNGTKEILFMNVRFDMNKATGKIEFESRKSKEDYLKKELDWYLSLDSTIEKVKDVKIWQNICSKKDHKVNSQYGVLVYGEDNNYQFQKVLNCLIKDKDSRQAVIIYNRPSIHEDAYKDGKHDFICTFYQQFFIRNNRLDCITNMRSNDCIFGIFNDLPWFEYVYNDMYQKLLSKYTNLEKGNLTYVANSFHCYERHFSVLEKIAGENPENQ
jgi:thymidylate synthase